MAAAQGLREVLADALDVQPGVEGGTAGPDLARKGLKLTCLPGAPRHCGPCKCPGVRPPESSTRKRSCPGTQSPLRCLDPALPQENKRLLSLLKVMNVTLAWCDSKAPHVSLEAPHRSFMTL